MEFDPDRDYGPSVVDFAHQIIYLDDENKRLRNELKHTKELLAIHQKSLNSQLDHQKDMLGMVMSAALDPDSNINRGNKGLEGIMLDELSKKHPCEDINKAVAELHGKRKKEKYAI